MTSQHTSYGIGCGKWKEKGFFMTKKLNSRDPKVCQRCGALRRTGKYCVDCRKIVKDEFKQRQNERRRLRHEKST